MEGNIRREPFNIVQPYTSFIIEGIFNRMRDYKFPSDLALGRVDLVSAGVILMKLVDPQHHNWEWVPKRSEVTCRLKVFPVLPRSPRNFEHIIVATGEVPGGEIVDTDKQGQYTEAVVDAVCLAATARLNIIFAPTRKEERAKKKIMAF